MTTLTSALTAKEFQCFSRFLIVGALGTFLDFGLLTLLKLTGLPTLVANTASFSLGVANNYIWNRLWTFGDKNHSDWKLQFMMFLIVSMAGLATNNILVLLLEDPLGVLLGLPEWGYLAAKVIATGVIVFWNYFANRNWTFKG